MGRRDNGVCHLGDMIDVTFGRVGVWILQADVRSGGRAVVVNAGCASSVNDRKYMITAGITGMRGGAGFVKQRFTA